MKNWNQKVSSVCLGLILPKRVVPQSCAMKHILIHSKEGSVLLETRRHTIGAKRILAICFDLNAFLGLYVTNVLLAKFSVFGYLRYYMFMCWILKTLFIFITCHRHWAVTAPDKYEYFIKDAARVLKRLKKERIYPHSLISIWDTG